MTLAKKVGAPGLHPDDETEMARSGMRTAGATGLRREQGAQQRVPRTRDETAAAAAIVTRAGRGADRREDAVQEVNLQEKTEMTENDLVVGRCLDVTIVTTLSEGQDHREGAVPPGLNAAKGRVLPSGDGRSLAPARGAIQSLESVPSLARGP